ncbi:MAG TPA: hypothetical protein VMG32_02090 [Anaeromyxobacteraceae bacterium]|nr:hypothetical protein [Anaeromyxobacteraceae bacterium]
MTRPAGKLLLLLWPLAALAQAISPGALKEVPVALALDQAIWQRPLGSTVSLEISLRNAFGEPVAALSDVRTEVSSPLFAGPFALDIPVGSHSGRLVFKAEAVGSYRLAVAAPGLSPASCVLVVRPSNAPPSPAPAAGGVGSGTSRGGAGAPHRPTEVEAAPPPPPAGPAQAPAPPATGFAPVAPRILLNPERVQPDLHGTWSAEMKVGFFDEAGRLVAAKNDFPVQLTARMGHLSNDLVQFKAGDYLSPSVVVTSTSDGLDQVSALTPFGTVDAELLYDRPVPGRLRVEAPSKVANPGGAARATIAVLLVSEGGALTTFSDRDLRVSLATSLGELSATALTIPRGALGTEATLTSARDGRARVTVDAPGLASGEATVKFSFPLWLALLAAVGGVAGNLVVRPPRGRARAHLVRSVLVGLVVGLLFYGVASFHAFADTVTLPLPVAISRIATDNEFGAIVLGLLGGLLGRAFWRGPGRPKGEGEAGAGG